MVKTQQTQKNEKSRLGTFETASYFRQSLAHRLWIPDTGWL